MIILDTNVVSEPLRPNPEPRVLNWLDQQAADTLYLTSISVAELLFGVACLPEGRRKETLETGIDRLIEALFGSRILSFDLIAARQYGPLIVRAKANGRAIAVGDGQIAAIASANGFSVATRDTAPFEAARLSVINPWLM
jgi:predicted nucleic acid-binding protein